MVRLAGRAEGRWGQAAGDRAGSATAMGGRRAGRDVAVALAQAELGHVAIWGKWVGDGGWGWGEGEG